MAVQKSRKTRSKRGMRRAHDSINSATLSENPTTGEVHMRHHVTPDGFHHSGREVIKPKQDSEDKE